MALLKHTHTTRHIIFLGQRGGLGVPNVEWIYTATRLTHLLPDLRRRKVPLATDPEDNFLGLLDNRALESGLTGQTSMTCASGPEWSSDGHGLTHKPSQ